MSFKIQHNSSTDVEKVEMKADKKIGIQPPLPEAGFFWIIAGPPGSGKSNLLVNLLTGGNGQKMRKRFYYKKFDKVYIWNPNQQTLPSIPLPADHWRSNLDISELQSMITEQRKNDEHVLWVFDDMISQIAEPKNLIPFMEIIFNRRHISKSGNGSLSIMMVTQAFNVIPLRLRKAASAVTLFNTRNKREIESIYEEFVSWLDKKVFLHLLNFVFKSKHDFLFIRADLGADESLYSNFNKIRIPEEYI